MSGSTFQFDYAAWSALFPELVDAGITELLATAYAGLAAPLFDTSGRGRIKDQNTIAACFNLLVAHIAKLLGPVNNGQSNAGLVGRISNASEGSVSVGTDMPTNPNAAWFNQTQYGALFWQMTAFARTWRYYPGYQPFRQVPGFGYPGV